MNRTDPHAGKTPGQPCGPRCVVCNAPRPTIRPIDSAEEARRTAYEVARALHREFHPRRGW